MRDLLFHPAMGLIRLWEVFYFTVIWLLEKPLIKLVQMKVKKAGINLVNVYESKDKESQNGSVKNRGKEAKGNEATDKMLGQKNAPSVNVFVHSKKFYQKLLRYGTLGIGEAYVDGLVDMDPVDDACTMYCSNGLIEFLSQLPWFRFIDYLKFEFFNLQTARRAFIVGEQHYDLGNELFTSFLDKNMNYSCGYWRNATNLDEAQLHKMDLIARKLDLRPGMRVLDIGCGWANLCKYLAEKYKVSVVGVTISVEQAKLAQERCQGLDVEIRVADYRTLDEKFDRIVSVGMFEHVGKQNYSAFFEVAHRCLQDDGIFLLHTIGVGSPDTPISEPWIYTHVFPNGRIPYHTEISEKADGLFLIEDWHNFGADYDKTLMAWHANFVKNWPTIRGRYTDPERFYRFWSYYLLLCAGMFRARKTQLWQVVLSKKGVKGGYISVR